VSEGRILAALLACPPTSSGVRTLNKVSAALPLTGCGSAKVANLFAQPAPDLPALNQRGREREGWLAARPHLGATVRDADALLIAWGLDRLTGPARGHRDAQVRWVLEEAARHGHTHAWTIGGQPRHPSRWHQYVSDKHGRTGSGSFEERLRQVLVAVPLDAVT
jgi:hypothetical protein